MNVILSYLGGFLVGVLILWGKAPWFVAGMLVGWLGALLMSMYFGKTVRATGILLGAVGLVYLAGYLPSGGLLACAAPGPITGLSLLLMVTLAPGRLSLLALLGALGIGALTTMGGFRMWSPYTPLWQVVGMSLGTVLLLLPFGLLTAFLKRGRAGARPDRT